MAACECIYDVFLSFRGEDTRKTFTDHLNTALVNAGLSSFRDDDELERGQEIRVELHKAIQQSRTSVIVFSKDYASSRWCLEELVMILDHKRKTCPGHVVLPVFYDVDPSQLRKQTGSLAKAFAWHKKKETSSKVKQWRSALQEVADLAGMVLQNQDDGHEAKFIQRIVNSIAEKLCRAPLSVDQNLVGIHSRVERINMWLHDESVNVGILIIYGIGGIGKTTIAKLIYNSNFEKFDGSSFLENIRQISEQPNGLVFLQTKLLFDIFHRKKVEMQSVSEGIPMIQRALRHKRVLLVIDDVDHMDQLNAVLVMQDNFCRGSRIIITTRHARLLNVDRAIECYNLETLDFSDSLKLFSWHAFGGYYPQEGYMELSERLVHHSGGLPLALKVFGSSLSRQSRDVWESALAKLEVIPNGEIMNKLKISYDSLPDCHVKDIFLHIACFFVGKERDYIVGILDGCDLFPVAGIQNLIDRCLITIDGDNKVQMHQMIRDMGRGIVHLESKDPGKRSRLCHPKDSFKVLTEKTGTEMIEGLVLDMHKHPAYTLSRESNPVLLETTGFVGMHKLRLLQLSHVLLIGCYKELPSGLRWLYWSHCTLDSVPSDFSLNNLVVLEMHYSSLRKVGTGRKNLPSLKVLDLSYSPQLTEITDFSLFPNLERLILKDCTSLGDVHQSIEKLEKLVYLNLDGCKTIEKLPENIYMLKSLETLVISGCSKLNHFPVKLRMLESLKVLQTNDIPISSLVSTIEARSCPRTSIDVFWASLPSTLVDLSLAGCNLSDNAFPRALADLSSLKRLNLSHNPIHSLPGCIRRLTRLDQLSLSHCKKLKSLLGLPRVGELMVNNCRSLEKISSQSLSYLPQSLGFSANGYLVEIEPWYKLEPLGKVDAKILNLLGLTDSKFKERRRLHTILLNLLGLKNMKSNEKIRLHSIDEQEVQLHTIDEQEVQFGRTYPLQGLYEFGIFNTFLPGNQVPGHFSHKSNGTSISFTVPIRPSRKIRGLNVFSVYENTDDVTQVIFPGVNLPHPIITKVGNISKGLKWFFGPTYYGIPKNGEEMIWLSHWKLEDQLEGNNKVNVSVFVEPWLQVKQCGVELVYEQNGKSTNNTSDPYSCVIGTGFSEEQEVMPGTYFLCPRPASIDNLDLCRSVWFKKLNGDSDEVKDEEEEQGDQNNCCRKSCRILIMAFFFYFLLAAPLLSHGE